MDVCATSFFSHLFCNIEFFSHLLCNVAVYVQLHYTAVEPYLFGHSVTREHVTSSSSSFNWVVSFN